LAEQQTMIKNAFAVLGLLASFALCPASAQDGGTVPAKSLAARYETVGVDRTGKTTRKADWYLVRTPNRVETAGEGQAEVWERSERGDISMRRVFRDDQFILEYHAGELRAMNAKPDWRALGSVIDPGSLSKLARAGSKRAVGRTAQVYRGAMGRDGVEIWWIDDLSLPAFVKRTGELGTYTMRLVEVLESAPSDWPLASHWQTREFRIIDVADLGDLEHDPVVKRVMRADAERRTRLAGPHAHD
jgi:hypothetical protein